MIEIPELLRKSAQRSAEVRDWIEGLPDVVGQLAERWGLSVGAPFQPGGSAAWVAPAGGGKVLKVGWLHEEALFEADGLRAWDGRGAVRLLADARFGATLALLIEACEPGTTLKSSLPPLEQDEVITGIMTRLWIEPPAGHEFPALAQMCDMWARGFTESGFVPPDAGLARAGLELWTALPRSAERSVLLCTDLHPDNVLAAERDPWLMVDPKPHVGDPAYEPLQHMLNFPDRLQADPRGFADRMAGLLDLDAERVRLWLFARCVVESDDWPGLWEAACKLAP